MFKLNLKYLFLLCALFVSCIQLNANAIQEDFNHTMLSLKQSGVSEIHSGHAVIKQARPFSKKNLELNVGDRKIEEIDWNFSKKYSACNNQFKILFNIYFSSDDIYEEVDQSEHFSKQNHYNNPLFVVFQVIKV